MIRPAVKPRQRSIHNQVPLFAVISLVAFLCSLTVLILLINKGDTLVGLGLVDRVYYVVLVFAGLTAAVFLFGVLPSSAAYEGRLLGGSLKLGGAIVGAALVVVGGYLLVPQVSTFPLTVYVHGEGGPQDIVLRNSGAVILELDRTPDVSQSGTMVRPIFLRSRRPSGTRQCSAGSNRMHMNQLIRARNDNWMAQAYT